MSKKRFGGFVLASALVLSAVTVVGLTSCGSTEKAETITAIAISNKSTLQAAWKVGEASRSIEATVTGSQKNLLQLVSEGTVTITSSDASVVKVEGVILVALKDGKSTITVACGELKDTVEITIAKGETQITSIVINNKAEIISDFHLGDDDRTLKISTDPVTNIPTALADGKLKITTSAPDIVAVSGLKLSAKKVGKATITVSYQAKTDTAEIEVLPEREGEVIKFKDLITEASTEAASNKGKYTKLYQAKAVVVATDEKNNTVVYDGESFAYLNFSEFDKSYKVGDTVIVKGKTLENYFGCMQFVDAKVTKLESGDTIAMPSAEQWDKAKIEEFKKLALLNNNKIQDPAKSTNVAYVSIDAIFEGESSDGYTLNCVTPEGEVFNVKKSKDKAITNLNKVLIGSKIKITGALLGYNSKYEYYNFILESHKVLEEPVTPTSIEISTTKTEIKVREAIEVAHKFGPDGSNAKLTIKATKGKDLVKINGNEVYALGEGEVEIQGSITYKVMEGDKEVTKTLTSNTIKLKIAGEMDDLVKKAETKTIDELLNIAPTNEKLFKVTGVVTNASKSDQYGNITITDKTTRKTVTAYGTAATPDCWTYTKDGKIESFTNPKSFGFGILGKNFNFGDEVEFIIYVYEHSGKTNYNFQFSKVVAKAETIPATLTITQPEGKQYVTASKTEGIKMAETIKLTTNSELIEEGYELIVKHNGENLTPKNGVYTFIANLENKVVVECQKIPPLGNTFTFNSADLNLGAYNSSTEPVQLRYGYSVSFTELGDFGDGIQSRINKNGKTGSLWLETTADREIESVTIKCSRDWGSDATYGVKFGTEVVKTFEDTNLTVTAMKVGNSVTLKNEVPGAKYVCLRQLVSGGVYIESITLNLKAAA